MNIDIKRHIDSARQVLVGVVPNPTSQIDQITNALIYKFMDDMDQLSIKNGGEPSFFIGDLEKYSWTRIMDSRIGNQERMNLFVEGFIKISESENIPQLFRNILKSAYLPYRSPEVLGLFLKEINYFDYSHPEDLGDAYEYLLSIMSSQGDAGQFRTPRHIIDFIVDAVNPTIEDKVLDPACGTAGFLISAYKHILEQHDGANDPDKKEKSLTPDQRKKLFNNFEGYDIDPGMVRIAQVNMYLHQFKNPKILQYDSLSMEERWNDKFDVILANPPFMSPKGGIQPSRKFSIQSTRSEVLFVDYIVNHLKPKGRAGIIVPEGIIFQSGTAHKQLRKNLVENGLYAVISLPSGVFNPYSGVKTSILLFDNEVSKKTSDILFIKIENDGYDLGAQRREISKNDLPQALLEINAYKKYIELGSASTTFTERIKKDKEKELDTVVVQHDKIILVDKQHIAKTGDYNLSGDRYRVSTDYSKNKWSIVELGEISQFIRGITFSAKDHATDEEDFVLVATTKAAQADGIRFSDLVKIKPNMVKKEETYLRSGDILISVANSANLLGRKTFIKELPNAQKYSFGAFMGLLRPNREKVIPRYLDSFLDSDKYKEFCLSRANTTTNISNLNWSDLQNFSIPLPPLEIQKQIVEELDGYQNIIVGAKQIVENWKPVYEIDSSVEKARVGDVVEFVSGVTLAIGDCEAEGGTPIITIADVAENGDLKLGRIRKVKTNKNVNKLKKGDLLFNWRNGSKNLVGKTAYFDLDGDYIFASFLLGIRPITERVISQYLWIVLNKYRAEGKYMDFMRQNINGLFNREELKDVMIPLPPLEIQKQIVEKVEAERVLIKSTKKLIAIYERKTKSAIDKLWEQ